ncbi:MAG: PAS-domain containing protein [Burkholderiaceae bacterium]|nr:PAS-domain containing protein [Burkholderiaceae bacterium]
MLASALLSALLRQQMSGRSRAEALARRMTADLGRLALVARRTSNAVVITDRQGLITWVNEGFERLTGHTAAAALGRSPGALLQTDATNPATVQAMREALSAGQGYQGEVLNRSKSGRHYWVELDIQPLHDEAGALSGFMAIELDITARKHAERGLARERQSLQNIIEGTAVGTWEWNVETGQTVFNERWAQIVGHSLASLGPTTIDTWARLLHPEDQRQSSIELERHFDSLTAVYECELRMRHRAGHWVWVLARGKLFSRSADGRPRWMAGTHMDITERKQVEAALRASQALLSRTGQIGGVGGWELDLATRTLAWTDETCRIHGVAPGHRPSLAEAIGYFAPAVQAQVVQAFDEAGLNGTPWDLELPLITAAGREIWVRALGEAESVDGRPVRLFGALQDITARRALEAELRAKNELVNSVIENLPGGLTVFDADLRLQLANRELGRLLALPPHLTEPGRTRFEDVIRFNAERGDYGSGDVDAIVESIVQRARGPVVPHQFERVAGSGLTLDVRGAPLPGGGFVTTYIDVTARRQAEAEASRSAALLRGAIDAIDEAFVLFDPDDRLVFCNDKYRRIYPGMAHRMVPGATFEEIVRPGAETGQYLDAVGRVDEWMAERLAAHRSGNATLVQRLDTGRTLRIVERKMADGHIVGFRIDVTELMSATEAAQKASVAKSQFLANMSHEIRTPMNAILGMLALLRRTGLTPRQEDYASKSESAARSLLGLLNDILDFSKVEAGKLVLDPQPFRIDHLMRNLGVILAAGVGAKPVEVLFDLDPALPRLLVGDEMRLQQVLINLGGNAVKFTAEGEVVVSARVLRHQAGEVALRFAVRDTGIGIAPDNQARIFSGFTQAEASTTRRYGGTGLGVAISQRLVALMGGELGLDSAPGRGSSFHFTLTLPVADDPAEPGRAAARRLHALVVDDNPTAREVLQQMTGALGWSADIADSGEAALALVAGRSAAGQRYDAVFVDWQMPGMDGWETTRRLRDGGLAGDPPLLVMVTAHGREKLEQRSPQEQAWLDGFLVKPVTASMLLDAVTDARRGRDQPHLSALALPSATAGARRLAGMRLLVTEDNLNNQQVARELLEDEGAVVQIAGNGEEGVAAVAAAEEPFDVVLMDLQMPVMDGFTATACIRQGLGGRTLPIVAMTANAMASDREACLAAGMNEHVGKPFDIDQLVAVLLRVSGRAAASAPTGSATVASPPAPLPAALRDAAAAAGVDLAEALHRLGGKQPVYERMLRNFVAELEALPRTLSQQLQSGAPAEAARSMHMLKGLAATLGLRGLSALASAAETPLAEGADAPGPVGEVVAAIGAALGPLAALLAQLQPVPASGVAPAASADPALLHRGLTELATLLENSDMLATERMLALKQQAGGATAAAWAELDDAVGRLDFERAVPLCRHLIMETRR